jgi:hypothetical protein
MIYFSIKQNNCQPRIVSPAKPSLQIEGEIKIIKKN